MIDSSTPAAARALTRVIKSASESQAAAEAKAFEQAQYAQRIWWTAARNLENACGIDFDDISASDLSNATLESLKAEYIR